MNNIDKNKQKLEEELVLLQEELSKIGHQNPLNSSDWEAEPTLMNEDSADENETADNIEEFEENTAVVKDLEIRYNDVKAALDKIDGDTYGMCEVCELPIEGDRLEANPAARTCKMHMEKN